MLDILIYFLIILTMNTVTWTKKAVKQLKRIHSADRKRIVKKVERLSEFPNVPLVKALTNHEHSYRLRVGNYRVIFNHEDAVKVIRIEEVKKRDGRTY